MLSMVGGLGRTRAFQVTTTAAATAARRCSSSGSSAGPAWAGFGGRTARLAVARSGAVALERNGRGANAKLRMVKVRGVGQITLVGVLTVAVAVAVALVRQQA